MSTITAVTKQVDTSSQTNKRMDAVRSCIIGCYTSLDSSSTSILDIVNAYIGYDQDEEALYDGALQKQMKLKSFTGVTSFRIEEARNSGLAQARVQWAINTLTKQELSGEIGQIEPSRYVTREYFENTLPETSGIYDPFAKNILLAMQDQTVIGFLISKVQPDDKTKKHVYYVHYLAVNSRSKRGGVGTQLMLTAMNKAKTLGLRLNLEFTHSVIKSDFYRSFTSRFAIPFDYEFNYICRTPYMGFSWDLNGVKGLETFTQTT